MDTLSMVEFWERSWEETRERCLSRRKTYSQHSLKGARRVQREYTYDTLGRWLTARVAERGRRYTTWKFSYGPNGLMDSMIIGNSHAREPEAIYTYTYDAMNRLTAKARLSSWCSSTEWTYLPNGKRATERFTKDLQFQYDSLGRLISSRTSDRTVQEWRYDADGHLASMHVQGHTFVYTWNHLGQNVHTVLHVGLTSEGTPVEQECTYTYDEIGRLVQEQCSGTKYTKAARYVYAYDDEGMLKQTIKYGVRNKVDEVLTEEYERFVR